MPFYWTRCDTQRALLSSIVPASVGIASICSSRPGKPYNDFIRGSVIPKWFVNTSQFHGIVDLLTLSPVGYASYLVYKYGGGFDYTDTSVALGLYGTNLLLAAAPHCLFAKRDYAKIAVAKTLAFITATATLIAFRQIDATAGWYVAPYALWAALWSGVAIHIYQSNTYKN